MYYLRGFVPWIAFAAVSSVDWRWGALAGLALGIYLLVQDRRSGIAADALILEFSTIAWFAALTAFSLARPGSPLEDWTDALSLGWLAATAWAGLAVRRPFTLGIARRRAPEQVWQSPVFLRINVVLSAAWAASFTATAALLALGHAADLGSTVSVPLQILGFAAPAAFTARYPDRARTRLA
jgi:hypothetical protein